MVSTAECQVNIRSDFAHARAKELALATGMTTKQVIEEALRAFHPPGRKDAPKGMVWKGRILVKRAEGRTITLEETLSSIEEDRNARGEWLG